MSRPSPETSPEPRSPQPVSPQPSLLALQAVDPFRRLVESLTDDAIFMLDTAGRVASWNAGAERIKGYAAAEILGQHVSIFFPPDAIAKGEPERDLEQARAAGRHRAEGWRVRKNGSMFWAVVTTTPLFDPHAAHIGYAKVTRDITDQHRAELELQASEARHRQLLEVLPDAVFLNVDGVIAYCNPALAKLLGAASSEALLGRPVLSIFHARFHPLIEARIQSLRTDAAMVPLVEEEVVRLDGQAVLVEVTATATTHQGRPSILVVLRDLRQRQHAEAALHQKEMLQRIAGRTARLGGWTIDLPDRKVIWSDEICMIHDRPAGYQPTLAEGIDYYPPEYRARVADVIEACAADGTPFDFELELITALGRRIWVRSIGEAVRDATGRIVRLQGAFQDISDRKQAEEAQRQLAAQLTATLESITDGFFTLDQEWRFTYVNAEAERMIVRTRAELLGITIWEAFPETVGSAFERQYRRAVADKVTVGFAEYYPPLGRWFAVRVYPSEQGLAVYFLDVTAARHAEEALLLRDRAIQEVSQGIVITDPNRPDNPIIYVSAGTQRITGYTPEQLLGKNCRIFQGPGTDRDEVRKLHDAVAAGHSCAVEILTYRRDGTPFWNAMSINPIRDDAGRLLYFVGVQNDVTDRKQLELQLRQSQKMEAVGRLAGGVAHDFNNLLTIISGYSELLLASPETNGPAREPLRAIREAGERATALTRQLLGFSRQTMLQPQVLDLNAVIAETGKMLRRLIGEDIHFTTVLAPQLGRVKVDPGQLSQVLMNLAVNARDAMPKGGRLTIETANVDLTPDYAATHLDCQKGPHVMLAMTDTGCGMTPDVQARIFEPFFTTKDVGQGTGLGLSMVFGIVQQSGGCIHVYSEPAHGTTFKIYLPAISAPATRRSVVDDFAQTGGSETILLVEDESGVRGLAQASLQKLGYHVLKASDGKDALRVIEGHQGPLDLLLTDVVMPNLGGPELADQMLKRRPGLKVLYMSGYTDDAVVRHGLLQQNVSFLQKPYTPLSLARKVRQVLDG